MVERIEPDRKPVRARTQVTDGSTGNSPPSIDAMTGIRALALFAVLAYHLQGPVFALLPGLRFVDPWMAFAFFALDVFFMLSGFVISYNYADRLSVLTRHDVVDFVLARVARIYPVFLLTLLVTAGLVAAFAARGTTFDPTRHYTVGGFLGNLFLLQAVPGVQAWNSPSWSIPAEAAAYLVFPVVAGVLVALRRKMAVLLSVGVVFALVAAIYVIVRMPTFSPLLFLWTRLVCEFALGCLLWAVWRHWSRPHKRWDLVGLASLGAVALIIGVAGASVMSWFAVGFLALFLLSTASATGPLKAVLASRPIEFTGRISYSVYLVHYPVLQLMHHGLPFQDYVPAPVPVRVAIVVVLFLCPLVLGALTYQYVEEPARRWIRRHTSRRRVTSAPVADRVASAVTTPAR